MRYYRIPLTPPVFVIAQTLVEITFDPAKRDATLDNRGIGFADAGEVFAGPVFEFVDDRHEYGEARVVTIGFLTGRMVVMVWTAREEARHIISMRKANDREQQRYRSELD